MITMGQSSENRADMEAQAENASPYVLSELKGQVLWLTLNRAAQRNPLSSRMISALSDALALAADETAVRVVVISATGPVFSAGHDLREMGRLEGESRDDRMLRIRSILDDCARMMLAIVHSPKAVIACVQGTATAAGCQLVSACDLALASENAKFCTPGVNIGTFCTTPLVGIGRNMHRKHAMELALTGDLLPAEDALRFGLVNKVVHPDHLIGETEALAAKIASKSAKAIRNGKETFYRQVEMPLEEAFRYATEAMLKGVLSPESTEGSLAFLQKRSPDWGDAGT
jgi:enoyl-CoA hydratase/carnithine racemase